MALDKNKGLLIMSGWMGDLMFTVPAIKGLSNKFSSLSMVVSEQQQHLAQGITGIERIFVDKKSERRESAKRVRNWARQEGVGTFVDWVTKFKTSLFMPWRIGSDIYTLSKKDTKEFSLHPFSTALSPMKGTHKVDKYINLIESNFDVKCPINFDLEYTKETREKMEETISQHEFRNKKSVLLTLGSAQYSKIWEPEKYLALARELEEEGINVAIMGARDFKWNNDYDLKKGQTVFKKEGYPIFLEGQSVLENSYLLRQAGFDVVVGSDSFGGHMAGSANEVSPGLRGAKKSTRDGKYFLAPSRTITIAGPTDMQHCCVYDPSGDFNTIVFPDNYNFLCAEKPCGYGNRGSEVCPNYGKILDGKFSPCISSIPVSRVKEAVMNQLEKSLST